MSFSPKLVSLFLFGCFVCGCSMQFPARGLTRTKNQNGVFKINRERIKDRIERLAAFGKSESGGVNRVAFSEADKQARAYVISLMEKAGMSVRVDAGGNIIGRREGKNPNLPAVAFGSHIDTVPEGGKYDGALGVLAAIECVQVLSEHKFMTTHPLEVFVFTDEEGGLIGSRVMIGNMTPEALEVVSHSGKKVGEGINFLGGDVKKLSSAELNPQKIAAFIELHIEQGSVLEDEGTNIGVVEGIVGIHWWDVAITGMANHAGTTPMNKRKDALLAAAHLIILVNDVAKGMPGNQVATVGKIKAEPGAPNVIPGKVVMSLEIRDLSEDKIRTIFQKIVKQAEQIEQSLDVRIKFSPIDAKSIPAPVDERIKNIIAESARNLGYSYRFMPSGAGHDAQNMAKIVPTGMLFVPSVGGISHSPKEYTRPEDMVRGANVLLYTILNIDQQTH